MHIPVLLNESLKYINPQNGDMIIDATFGYGGHTQAILNSCKNCTVLGIDRDPDIIDIAKAIEIKYPQRFTFCSGRFSEILGKLPRKYNKILFDFGVSSPQLDTASRGFSFSKNGPLDMRMSKSGRSAYDVVNTFNEKELSDIIYYYGNENKAKKIAKAIVQSRPINTTIGLREVIVKTTGKEFTYKTYSKVDIATKTFQAIRIFVNDELEEIHIALNTIPHIIVNGGLVVTITFHSLEDRIVKNWIKINKNVQLITNPIISPTSSEISKNPRSRSAKLRAFYVN